MTRPSLRLFTPSLALAVLAACGGKSAPTTAPAIKVAPAEPRAVQGAGIAYGGAGYGGAGYGDIYGGLVYGGAGYGGDPCSWGADPYGGDPCGTRPSSPPPPVDPPELAGYLPPVGGRVGAPDPAVVYSVPLHDSPRVGPATAPVTMVVTFEFADPYSDRLRSVVAQLGQRYDQDLRVVWKHFIVHRSNAQVSALAACAAAKQGKFIAFHHAMFDAAMGSGGNRRYDLEAVRAVADAQRLDRARFDADLASTACKDEVIRDQKLFESLGQAAVPVTWINGRVVQGAQPIDKFAALIDEELARAKAALAKKGAKPANYYPGLVKSGRTSP